MIFNGSPDERLIILKALEHEADDQNDFVAGLDPDSPSTPAERQKALAIMALFDAFAKEGGFK